MPRRKKQRDETPAEVVGDIPHSGEAAPRTGPTGETATAETVLPHGDSGSAADAMNDACDATMPVACNPSDSIPTAGDEPAAKPKRRAESAGRTPMLRVCEDKLGYVFAEPKFLQSALTHASGAPYRLASNERMEFLGDAILGMIVCELLYHRYPKSSEGDLTKIKSVVVSRQTCAHVARRLGLDEHLVLGKGMTGNAKLPTSLLAGVFESLVAAIYLDGGMEAVRGFVERTMTDEVDGAVESEHGHNFKSLLQQLAQRVYNTTPTYALLDERGPDHRKSFLVSARIGGHEYAPAWGANKKEAEQKAAQNALEALDTAGREREPDRAIEGSATEEGSDAVDLRESDGPDDLADARQPYLERPTGVERIVKEHAIEPAEESAADSWPVRHSSRTDGAGTDSAAADNNMS